MSDWLARRPFKMRKVSLRIESLIRLLVIASVILVSSETFYPAFAQSGSNSAGDNVLKIGNGSEINSLDPHTIQDAARLAVKVNTYDPLYRWVGNPPRAIPWLATGYTVSPDGLVYTVALAKGAKFHDETEITADDVVYSMDRMLNLKQGSARFFLPIIDPGKTKAIDRYTVEFTLKHPAAPFAGLFSEIFIVNKAMVQAHEKTTDGKGDWGAEWLSSHTAGSGPFHITEYDPAVGWYAERFKDHFTGWPDKTIDGIRFRTIREINSQTLALTRGDIDYWMGTISPDQFERLRKVPSLVAMQAPHQRLFLINFNNLKPPFDNIHVRRAFSYAFDYDGFIHGILNDKVRRDPEPMPSSVPGFSTDVKGFTYDLDKAKAELALANIKPDRTLNIYAMTGFAMAEQAAQVLQAGLRKIGINANVVAETWPTLADKCRSPDNAPEMMPIWASANYADPHTWAGEMYDSTRWGSYATCSFYKNPKVDALLTKAFVSQDQDERAKLYADVNVIVAEDAPSIFISEEIWINVRNRRMQGYEFTPVGSGNFLKGVWLDQPS
jgi:peptide/nickel transport system substrate-binding protein